MLLEIVAFLIKYDVLVNLGRVLKLTLGLISVCKWPIVRSLSLLFMVASLEFVSEDKQPRRRRVQFLSAVFVIMLI